MSRSRLNTIVFTLILVSQTTPVQSQINPDSIPPHCACPEGIQLNVEKALHADVEVDGEVIGGAATVVPAGTSFAFDTVFFHNNNRFYSAVCQYAAVVQFKEPVTIGDQDYTEGQVSLKGLEYAYAPFGLSEILCKLASNDIPVGPNALGSNVKSFGDSARVIRYSYVTSDENCFGTDQIEMQSQEIISNLSAAALLRTCGENPTSENFVINSVGDAGLNVADFQEYNICTTGDSIMIDGEMVPECTLRAAIEYVNARRSPNLGRFSFDIPTDRNINISTQPLADIKSPIELIASKHPVFISGHLLPEGSIGLSLAGSNSQITGLTVQNFDIGILLRSQQNKIDNLSVFHNRIWGVSIEEVDNTIMNSIIGNNGTGINLSTTLSPPRNQLTKIENNFIGWSQQGDRIPNRTGIHVLNSHSILIQNNVISGNLDHGLCLETAGEIEVRSNLIGIGPQATIIRNEGAGIFIDDMGGDILLDGNTISSNQKGGIVHEGDVGGTLTISNNFIGIDNQGELLLSNAENGISIHPHRALSFTPWILNIFGNVVCGNHLDGLYIDGDRFQLEKYIHINIQDNYFGVPRGFQKNFSNRRNGINIKNILSKNPILIAGNNIGQNLVNGINVESVTSIDISSNFIGISTSHVSVGNERNGIYLKSVGSATINQNIIGSNLNGIFVDRNCGPINIFTNRIGIAENLVFDPDFGNLNSGIRINKNVGTRITSNNLIAQNTDGIFAFNSKILVVLNQILANNFGIFFVDLNTKDFSILASNRFCHNDRALNAARSNFNISLSDFCDQKAVESSMHLNNSNASIQACRFYLDAGDAIYLDPASTATISRNNFIDNQGLAINNQNTSASVPAAGNWFGDASGPSGAGPGTGDGVSSSVDFQDWLVEPVSVVGAAISDTIYVPTGDTVMIPVYGQNWVDRDDQLNFSLTEVQDWSVFNPDQLTFLFIEDSLALEFPNEFIIPANPDDPENQVNVVVRSLNMPQQRDTVSFLLIAQERQLSHILLSPDTSFVEPGDTIRYFYTGLDQFGELSDFEPVWMAEGGIIDTNGVFIAGNAGGTFRVSVSGGGISSEAVVVIDGGGTTDTKTYAIYIASKPVVYPNPFANRINIRYSTPAYHAAQLFVFDIYGRAVYSHREYREAGAQELTWDGMGATGSKVFPGIYFFRLHLGEKEYTGRLIKL